MDSTNGGQSSDLARQTAAQIARKKVLAAYSDAAQKSALDAKKKEARLKDTPVTTKIDSESWKKYHSAWQNYYQKYYNDYYSRAAQNYVAKERLKDAREKAEEEEILKSLAKYSNKTDQKAGMPLKKEETESNTGESVENIGEALRRKIRKRATDSVKKTRRRRRYIPIVAGIAVVLLVLFLQYNRLIFAPIMAYVSPGNAPASSIEAIDPNVTGTVSPEPRLIIPKLNVDVPINFNVALSDVMAAMNHGVAHYRIAGASAYPGEIGNFVITVILPAIFIVQILINTSSPDWSD
jgi:sortase A